MSPLRRYVCSGLALLLCAAGSDVTGGIAVQTLDADRVLLTAPIDDGALVIHFWATWCPEGALGRAAWTARLDNLGCAKRQPISRAASR